MISFCLFLAVIFSPVLCEQWKANVVKNLNALVSSCVVVPCTFSYPNEDLPTSRLRGIWHPFKSKQDYIYYEDQTRVLDSFKGRTKLLGNLGQKNCTLEITDVKNHDNGPFCFRVELAPTESDTSTKDKYSFVEECVTLNMLPDPPKPTLHSKDTGTVGHVYTISCTVEHSCPSHPPSLTWSRSTEDGVIEVYTDMLHGIWKKQSILTFIPEEKDDHSDITCTAEFHERKTSSATKKLHVKRVENNKHIIIPAVVGISIAVIFGVVCALIVKRYKGRIAELQSQDGSMWNRLSRLSRRIHSGGPGQFQSTQRVNKVKTHVSTDQKVPKPRFPSPKSQPKACHYKQDLDDGDDYMNTADLSVYGNL
ncbi:myelin-associated glycoprotein-like [Solea solea]|uniref:myelin-associated glycoprotein-like n=1 Tax=Solea solea TaxID=90069 RepID=UPI00272AE5CA|nr:myelin-associated glycoprotein-like [Solea solea]